MIDSVVGALLFGLVVNEPGRNEMMLRVLIAGTAPGVGEVHYVLASDSLPRPAKDGSVDVRSKVDGRGRENAWAELAPGWKALGGGRSRRSRTECFRQVSGCPDRFSFGHVRGSRFLGLAPEPASWEM